MDPRSRGRFLAPLALVATIAVAAILIERGVNHGHAASAPSHASAPTSPASAAVKGTKRGAARPVAAAFYVVRPGDSLSVISARENIPLPTLEALNPGVNPGSLQTGERLKLRR